MWYEPSTGKTFSSIHSIRVGRQDVSLPESPSADDLFAVGIIPLVEDPQPVATPYVDRVVEDGVVVVGDTAVRKWKLKPMTPDEIAHAQMIMVAACDAALTAHLDATAQARRYDNRVTCALRAGYAGPFQAEGQAFAAWMDSCNAMAYQWMQEVIAGTRQPPASAQELIDALPTMVWP